MKLTIKDDYVFYERLQDSAKTGSFMAPYWEKLYQSAMNEFNGLSSITLDESNIIQQGQNLINMGLKEQAKEQRLINTVFGEGLYKQIDLNEYPQFINTINRLIGLKDKYATFLKKINEIDRTQKHRAPVATSFFDSRLNTAITESMRSFITSQQSINLIVNGDYDTWEKLFYSKTEKIIEKAIIDTANQKGVLDKKNNNEEQLWIEFSKLLNDPYMKNQFMDEVRKRYNFDTIAREVWNFQTNNKTKKTRGLSTAVKKGMNLSEQGRRSVAGFVYEYLNAALRNTDSSKGIVLKNNIATADTVALYSAEMSIDLAPMLEVFNEVTVGSSLEETRTQVNRFHQEVLSKIDNTFVVYGSAKAYTLKGLDSRGFGKGGTFTELANIAGQIGKKDQMKNLLNVFRNTAKGAIGEGRGEEIKEKVRATISEAIAFFLFDDWEQIGYSNNNSIHVFDLDGITVPLSYLLIAAGKAIQETKNPSTPLFKLHLTNPQPIIYKEPLTVEEMGGNSIYHFWNIQREVSLEQSRYDISFIRNFTQLISQLLKAMS